MDRADYGAVGPQALPDLVIGGAGLPPEETEAVLLALGQAIEARDTSTRGHCERLAFHSLALGVAMGLGRHELLALYRGGYLHDIGKVGMPDTILFKPAALSKEEWDTMRRHPLVGEEICRRLKTLGPVLPIIRGHHERWDGSGYPDGLRGSRIPLLARVLQLADIYDALTTVRPYKRAFTPKEALAIMEEETARGWRDPELMALFVGLHRKVIAAIEDFSGAAGDLASMEASLRQLQRNLARQAGPAPRHATRGMLPAKAVHQPPAKSATAL
ncbi:MAG TPA: HD domain-containing phosphohydrolase [Bryobacteraceae bacterium]|nr:HD domain-containing phosphohydrolase [Bryobacteraceae bacterium]